MNLRTFILAVVCVLTFTANSGARSANEKCPFPEVYIVIDRFYHECVNGLSESCDYFLDEIGQLFPRYDCQRYSDTKPVPAIWLFSDAALDYIRLLYQLSSVTDGMFDSNSFAMAQYRAKEIFLSKEFRSVLDGHIAEEYFPLIEEIKRNAP